jgi:3-phosphoshikimate 1-carboxyvinyltransferase
MTVIAPPQRAFTATATVPSDKSCSHRALVLAAMAEGQSRVGITGTGADVAATQGAIHALGVEVEGDRVLSRGIRGWRAPRRPIDCANSGTTMRILAGALAGSRLTVTLEGDESLSHRPMRRLTEALAPLGGRIDTADGTPPVTVVGRPLHGAEVGLPIASAQVRTAVALAALSAQGPTLIDSPAGFRDHTERWLAAMGRGARRSDTAFEVAPGPVPPLELTVPGDPSSAAFLWAAAALSPGSAVTTPGVGLNPGRLGLLTVLERMGAVVEVEEAGAVLGDPWGNVTVTGAGLSGVEVAGSLSTACLDELPLVAVLAASADGETVVRDAAELRVKESDRIAASVRMVRALGGEAAASEDGFVIGGGGVMGGTVEAGGDHRIAMAGAVAAVAARSPVRVEGFEVAAVSWPGFETALESLWS